MFNTNFRVPLVVSIGSPDILTIQSPPNQNEFQYWPIVIEKPFPAPGTLTNSVFIAMLLS